ncbi:hypothetical protein [Xanthomonas sp. 3058]|uniref:hypothetical protein n=1 Tax=Xanthomonas sp. 3058 TaxID=3035314 RepID=UPI0017E96FE4|nr:hypothetical protein [Xanthomonas sp. 3058]MBB5864795.1 hypothetical protein [Xanthomonas sp. 3058]
MEGLFVLGAFALAWFAAARFGRARGWGRIQRHGLGLVAGFMATAVVGAVLGPVPNTAVTETASIAPKPAVSDTASVAPNPSNEKPNDVDTSTSPTLGLTLDEYVQNFNVQASRLSLADRANPDIQSGAVNDVATLQLAPSRFITVSLSKGTKDVQGVSFIGIPDGSHETTAQIILASGIAVHAAFGSSPDVDVADVLGKMLTGLKPNDGEKTAVIAGKEVSARMSDVLGLSTGVAPAVSKHR